MMQLHIHLKKYTFFYMYELMHISNFDSQSLKCSEYQYV